MLELKNNTHTGDARLDRIQEFDERSRNYRASELITTNRRAKKWRGELTLDQGEEGACTGFALAKALEMSPNNTKNVSDALAKEMYCEAQRLDPWPGGECEGNDSPRYSGTSILSVLKAAQNAGYVGGYYWNFGIDETINSLTTLGPVILGIPWLESMYKPRPGGLLEVSGRIVGGHAIVAYGYHPAMRIAKEGYTKRFEVVRLWNSWGDGYGEQGKALIKVEDLEQLLKSYGESVFVMGKKRLTL